jgi:hypothetical protein
MNLRRFWFIVSFSILNCQLFPKNRSTGPQAFLYDIKKIKKRQKIVILRSQRIYNEEIRSGKYSFTTKSPINTVNSMRIFLPSKPLSCSIEDKNGKIVENSFYEWDSISKTCYLSFDNNPEGITVIIQF